VQGLAPQWFEVEVTGYIGRSGRTHARVEAEYELLLTNRLVLQPLVEAELYGRRDPARGLGAGLSSVDAGLRLRYEVRRELAPYVGIIWHRATFETADFAREVGGEVGRMRFAIGLRAWF
jgi:copper resistance protein B